MPPAMTPPYPGSRALVKIGTTWITGTIGKHINNAHWTQPLRDYCKRKYTWSDSIFDSIDWKLISTARKKCTLTQLMQTSKIMHDWLPVMHMHGHVTGVQQCPACAHPDETLDHLFHCTHPALMRSRDQTLTSVRSKGRALGITAIVVQAICGLIFEYYYGTPYVMKRRNNAVEAAIEEQRNIGIQFIPRGYLGKQWRQTLLAMNCENADRKLATFLYSVWVDSTDAIWRARNDIVHHGNNLNRQADESRIDRRLRWFKFNHQDVLARTDFHLTHYNPDELHVMPLAIKRERLRQLDIAQKAYALECKLKDAGLQKITRYFKTKQSMTETSTGH